MRPMSLPCLIHCPSWVHRAALLACLWFTGAASAAGNVAAPVVLEASRDAGRIDLSVRTTVAAPYAVIWAVLTDYENTARWVPDMDRSVVLQRKPRGAVVEQSGQAEVLVFRISVNAVVEVEEFPPERIEVRLVRGDFKQLTGAYELKKIGQTDTLYELRWRGRMELASAVPGFVAQPLLVGNVQRSFEGLVREMERRAGVVAEGAP